MSTFSQFFSPASGLYAVPPKRITIPGFGGSATILTYGNNKAIPCASAAGTFFSLQGSSTGNQTLINSTTGATIASIAPSAVITGTSQAWTSLFTYSATARVLYVAATNAAGQVQLAAISDTTGAVTLIGAAFTPTTLANWTPYTTGAPLQNGYSFIDGAGNLIYLNNAVAHSLNPATGAVNYQNANYALSDGTTFGDLAQTGLSSKPSPYITADNSAAIILPVEGTSGNGQALGIVSIAKGGVVAPNTLMPIDMVAGSQFRIMRCSLWVAFLDANNSSGAYYGWRFYDPTDFDRYVHDLIFAIAGV